MFEDDGTRHQRIVNLRRLAIVTEAGHVDWLVAKLGRDVALRKAGLQDGGRLLCRRSGNCRDHPYKQRTEKAKQVLFHWSILRELASQERKRLEFWSYWISSGRLRFRLTSK